MSSVNNQFSNPLLPRKPNLALLHPRSFQDQIPSILVRPQSRLQALIIKLQPCLDQRHRRALPERVDLERVLRRGPIFTGFLGGNDDPVPVKCKADVVSNRGIDVDSFAALDWIDPTQPIDTL